LEQSQLQREFYKRLSLSDITLSAREQEVCLGLLTGGTVPQMAEKLSVKNSSIETYLKRAAAKLGVSGRHGLAKWMVGA
jgi:DNA-binding NarL/FixJ family response regulator